MADQTKSIKGTKTEQCLANAYVAESTAVTRYTYFAQAAEKEMYYQVANIFKETADNELHHGKIFLKLLQDSTVSAPISIDPGILSPTLSNLKVAAAEEKAEGVEEYTKSAEIAEEEGFPEIAQTFRAIATIERHHMERFDKLAWRIENGTMWKRDQPIKWQCLVCGYIFEGVQPPEKCPACKHPYQHFMPAEENF